MNAFFFFFNDTASTEIYTLTLHDALPISPNSNYSMELHYFYYPQSIVDAGTSYLGDDFDSVLLYGSRSEEHTSELQSRLQSVCRLLLKKTRIT